MLRVSALALAASFWPALPAAAASHFDQGRQAFERGRYEVVLHEMMLVVMARPTDKEAREYMRWAGEKLIAQQNKRVERDRRALLKRYQDALERGRRQAANWAEWLEQSRVSAKAREWARAHDEAQRVLDENGAHADAEAARKRARRGLTRVLARRNSLGQKDKRIYRGLFYLADGQKDAARVEFNAALALKDASGEIFDDRVRLYLVRAGEGAVPAAGGDRASPRVARRKPRSSKPPVRATPDLTTAVLATPPEVVTGEPGKAAYELGVAKASQGLHEEAIALYARALNEAPGNVAAGEALMQAKAALRGQRQSHKAEAAKLYRLGLMLYGQGKLAESVTHLKRVVALDPNHGYAQQALSHAEQELQEQAR